jgi:MoaA/NifB/PqqE/SkfB family radical SAM enzyme
MMIVEVVGMGQCNLRCPSCPVGNMREVHNPMGMMKPDLLTAIVRKGVAESGILDYSLYNWGEPLIHPKIADLVRAVQENGGRCHLSSNLNFNADWDALMAANPYILRISCSAFNQSKYAVTHRGGDIEVVKRHMRMLSEARTRAGATTAVHMLFHRYKDNLDDEAQMRDYCRELGFEFQPVWAYFMPYEKVVAFAQAGPNAAELSDEDRALIDRLGMPLAEVLEACRAARNRSCSLQDEQIVVDNRGEVVLCCSVFEAKDHIIARYLETPVAEIQKRKQQHPTCTTCMSLGLHVYSVYGVPEMAQLAAQRTLAEYATRLGFAIA